MKSILSALDEVAKRRESATKGPWEFSLGRETSDGSFWMTVRCVKETWRKITSGLNDKIDSEYHHTLEFIAASRTEHELLEKALRIALKSLNGIRDRNYDGRRDFFESDLALKEIEALFKESSVEN